MIYFSSMFFPTIIETYIGALYIKKLKELKKETINIRLLYLVIGSILMTICKITIHISIVTLIISAILFILSISLCLQITIKETVTPYIYTVVFMLFFVELPTIPLARIFADNEYMIIIHCILIFILGLFLIKILPLNTFYNYISNEAPTLYLLITNIFLLAIFISWYAQINRTYFFENALFILFISIVIVFINLEVIISSIKDKEKNKRLELLEQYLPVLDEMIQTIRKKQHNYNSKIMALRALPYTYKNYDDLSNALIDDDGDINDVLPSYLLNMNLTIIAGYLYKKRQEAYKKQNKNIDITIDKYDLPTTLPQYEIIELMDILINNSLEAIPSFSSMELRLSKTDDDKIIIETKNQGPAAGTELNKKIFSYGFSSKKTNDKYGRGLGLTYLKEYVDGHNGTITITNETIDGVRNLVFTVEV